MPKDGKLASPGFFESYGAAKAAANAIDSRSARSAQSNKNTSADAAEAESTAVNDNPATHTPKQMQTIEEYKNAVSPIVKSFVEKVRTLQNQNYKRKAKVSIGFATDQAVADIAEITGIDVAGSDYTLSRRAIEHIDRRHGANGEANQSISDINDIARIGYVVENYDGIESIERHITSKTKAIMPVHLYGYPCDMDRIMPIARAHGLYVVEDCAQAHTTRYKGKLVGTFGDVACYSFQQSKHMTTGDGGMVMAKKDMLCGRIRLHMICAPMRQRPARACFIFPGRKSTPSSIPRIFREPSIKCWDIITNNLRGKRRQS